MRESELIMEATLTRAFGDLRASIYRALLVQAIGICLALAGLLALR
ncbi:hypothetical protein [Hyphomicrobium sp. 2TAF46]